MLVSQNLEDLKDVLLKSQLQTSKAKRKNTREACSAGWELFRKLSEEVGSGQRLSCVVSSVNQSSNSCSLSPGPLFATAHPSALRAAATPLTGEASYTQTHSGSFAGQQSGSSFLKRDAPWSFVVGLVGCWRDLVLTQSRL